MSNPAYLWLTDVNGSPVVGDSMVFGRLGAIELKAVAHHLTIPVSGNTRPTNRYPCTYTDCRSERI